jgi:hypothetical protein
MGIFTTVCPKCGRRLLRGRKFCPSCGEGLAVLFRICPNCTAVVSGKSKFCAHCGKPVEVHAETDYKEVSTVWLRSFEMVEPGDAEEAKARKVPKDFAYRFEIDDLKGAFRGGVVVEHGTRAALLVDGKLIDTLGPGRYDLAHDRVKTIQYSSDPQHATVVLVEAGDTVLDFVFAPSAEGTVGGLLAADGIPVEARTSVVVRLADLSRLLENVLGAGRDFYAYADLRRDLYGGLRDAVSEAVSAHAAFDLSSKRETKENVESALQRHLARTLDRMGLELVQVEVFVPVSPEVERVRREAGEVAVADQEVEVSRARVAMLEKARKLKVQDFGSEQEMERAVADIAAESEKAGVERDALMQIFRDEMERAREDKKVAWEHFQEKLKSEHALEMERLRKLESERTEAERQEIEDAARVKRAGAEAQIAGTELETERKKAELGLDLRGKKIQQDLDAKRGEVQIEAEAKEREIEALSKMSPEQMELYLAEDENRAAVLIARAKASGNRELLERMLKIQKEAYERGYEMVENVAPKVGAGVVPMGIGMVPGAMHGGIARGGYTCPGCQVNVNVTKGDEFCPNCGTKVAGGEE